jgi:hypothetical protein
MEKDFRDIGFEGFLREQTDRHKVSPSEQTWLAIHQRMHPNRRWPNLVAAVALFGLGVLTGVLLDEDRPSTVPQEKKSAAPASALEVPAKDGKASAGSTAQKAAFSKPTVLLAAITARQAEAPLQRSVDPIDPAVKPSSYASKADQEIGGDRGTAESTLPEPKAESLVLPPRQPAIGALGLASIPSDRNHSPGTTIANREGRKTSDKEASGPVRRRRSVLQVYFSPSISYRRLVGQATQSNFVYTGLPYSANLGFPTDVNKAVTHKPSLGMEIGAALSYPITSNLRFKAGLQFNLNNYDIEAYNYTPEMAPLTAAGSPGYNRPINTVSYYRNFFGFSRTWLRNSHFMVSTPVGLELNLPAGRRMSLNVASTIQPTYTLRNNSYLISTNLKNYAQEPSLYRDWNVHAGAEAYLSVSKGSYRWIAGPQIRYQLLSSYKDNYPISEHLIDYGMKFGIQKTIR